MRRLLSLRWLAVHLGVLAVVLVFCRLGWWQWDRARSTGGVQNIIYALQWPSFAVFGLVMWWKTVRDELHPSAVSREVRRPLPAPSGHAVSVDEPEDEELAAYNRYLAWLSARDEQRAR